MSDPLVGIVILNWNRLELTKQCLKKLSRQSYQNKLVVVIDNGSTDGSVEWLESQDITLIKNPRNLGFARAVNQGIELALDQNCKYVSLLNNDAEPAADWLEQIVNYLEKNQAVGYAQGATMELANKKIYDSTGIYLEDGFMPRQRASGSTDPHLDIPAVGPNAAGAVYRSTMLRNIPTAKSQWFDSRFFAYVEDVDLDLRAHARGYKFGFVPSALLYHRGSVTGNSIARRKMFWGARNQIWLVYKNAPWPVIKLRFKAIAKSHLANLQFLWREQRPNFWPYLEGLVVGLLGLPLFWRKRHHNLKLQKLSDDDFLTLLVPANPPLSNPIKKLLNLIK